ncbi:MAG: P-loop NTPase fold protein [Opitutae bacterium]|nr:P-loop NTPase fold protein [Opitutae bacterium]
MSEDETTSGDIPTVTRFPLSVETFAEDALGLEPFCRSLESYLMVDHDFVEGSLVVSLNAEFGFGKSTFLKMWENDLNARRKQEATSPLAINLNAWESDYCDEPLLPIISALIEAIEATVEQPDTDPTINKLKEAAKDVAWFTVGIGNSIVKEAFKVDPFAAGKITQEKRDARKQTPTDLLDAYQKRRHALWNLKESLAEYFGGEEPSAFIFIDELDRCRPDYAVSYLETIKHVFDIHGLVFVLAVDYAHLKNSAKSLYGPDLNFDEYFRKFAHRSFELPKPDEVARKRFARSLTDYYLHNKSSRFSRLNMRDSSDSLPDLISALEMTPRQAMEFFRILGHLSSTDQVEVGSLSVGYGLGMMLMSALKASKHELYQQLGTGGTPHKEIIQIFKDAFDPQNAHWWFLTYLTGFSDLSPAYSLLKEAGLLPSGATEDSTLKQVAEHARIWGRGLVIDHYPQFHAMIESKQLR